MADAHTPAAHGHDSHGHDPHGHGHEEEHEHIHEVSYYAKVYAALVVLFLISFAGPFVGIFWLTMITAFGVACIKASLVVKYFMHLDVEKRFVHYFLGVSLMFMFLFFFAVAPDVMNHEGSNWKNVAAKAAVERGLAAGPEHLEEHGGAHEGAEAKPGEHGATEGH